MVTFKLIQLYPGSKPLGYILKPVNNGLTKPDNYYQNGIWFNPSDYPKYWQEVKELSLLEEKVVEKDYEILSFKDLHSSRILTLSPNKQHYQDGNMYLPIEKLLPNIKNWSIYSVKRISDSEVFTIGDKAINNTYSQYCGIISEIFIKDNKLELYISETIAGNMSLFLSNAKKYKKPLFITADGVDIFEADYVYGVKFYMGEHELKTLIAHDKDVLSTFIRFSTKEAAEEYILMNKPLLSLSDVWDNLKVKDRESVLKFVKSKLNKNG